MVWDKRRYVLFAARLVPEKGCHYLLEAFARICPPDVDLVIAGEDLYNGAYAQNLKSHAGPQVRFVGAVLGAEFRALVQHADVFVLPSQIEGLSTGLLEAMAARRCIVASALPENLEALGDTGLTFPAGDVEQLANSLQAALADGALRERMGAAAAARVSQLYDWDRSTEQLESIYERVLRAGTEAERELMRNHARLTLVASTSSVVALARLRWAGRAIQPRWAVEQWRFIDAGSCPDSTDCRVLGYGRHRELFSKGLVPERARLEGARRA